MITGNVITDFCPQEYFPEISNSAYVHPMAAVIGHVLIGAKVMIAPFASVRGDEGHPILIGDETNIQDGVVIHGLETEKGGMPVDANTIKINGVGYSVYIGRRVSLAHQVQIHGPALVGDNSFIGMKSLLFKSRVGNNCVIEPGCIIIGVNIDVGRYVPAGTILKDQKNSNELPMITEDYQFRNMNNEVVHVNIALAEGYKRKEIGITL
ncbi:MAG: carbonic anhydrase [Deltaproteobacteria bacterium]|nr:carbonic anhydrase [Deltaproteobacteria bacterium]